MCVKQINGRKKLYKCVKEREERKYECVFFSVSFSDVLLPGCFTLMNETLSESKKTADAGDGDADSPPSLLPVNGDPGCITVSWSGGPAEARGCNLQDEIRDEWRMLESRSGTRVRIHTETEGRGHSKKPVMGRMRRGRYEWMRSMVWLVELLHHSNSATRTYFYSLQTFYLFIVTFTGSFSGFTLKWPFS